MKIKLLFLLFLLSFSTYAQNLPTYVPTNGLIAYYPFNGNANDASGNVYNGVVTGATLTTDKAGNPNSAYSFDGLSNYIDATIATIPQNNAPRTISGWFKTNTPNPNETMESCIFNYGSLSSTQRFALGIYSKGYLQFITGSNSNSLSSNNDYLTNTWYFLTITYDGTKASLYINGTYVEGGNTTLNTINKTFRIGKRITGDTYNEYFKGSIDDIGIWNRVLTQEEILGLYNSGQTPTYTLIPDVNFENKLIALGIDSGVADGKVLTNNINKLTSLDVSFSNVSDLTGIQDFVELKTLDCPFNNFTNLDISKNTNLTNLSCNGNQLTTLDISTNTALTNLSCNHNNLTTLDVTKNTALNSLDCSSNQLTNLDISNNTSLTYLECSSNLLTALDVSKNIDIDYIICHSNQLKNLDVSQNTILTYLYFSHNQLTNLDVSKNTLLNNLVCSDNPLKNIDVSKNLALTSLSCDGNQLTNLDVSQNTGLYSLSCSRNLLTNLDVSKNTALVHFYCSNNQLTTLDVSNNSILLRLECDFNRLTTLDVSKNPKLSILYCNDNQLTSLNLKNGNNSKLQYIKCKNNSNLSCIQVDDKTYSDANWANFKDSTASYNTDCTAYTLIPNSNFENKLIALGIDSGTPDGKVLTSNISSLTSLDVSSNNITDLTGIQDFVALKILNCSSNPLTSLDVSKNTQLTELYCNGSVTITSKTSKAMASNGQLTSLDLSNNLLLTKLNCSNNQLTTLDLSKNTLLTDINCSNNQLTFLNLNNNNNNNLVSFDFRINPSLNIVVDNEVYSNSNATWNAAKDATATYTSKALGIQDSVFDKITIYPNPTKGELHINNIILEKITIYDALGKTVKTTKFTSASNNNTINLAGLPKGIYYVFLQTEGTSTTEKIIVE